MKSKFISILMLLFVVIDSKAQDIDTYYIYKNNDSIKQAKINGA